MSEKKFHAFYTWAYGNEPRHEVFDDEAALLKFVHDAKSNPVGFRGLSVVYGEELSFEPATVIQTYRIRRQEQD